MLDADIVDSVNKGTSGTLYKVTGTLMLGPNLNEISAKYNHNDGKKELTMYFESTSVN